MMQRNRSHIALMILFMLVPYLYNTRMVAASGDLGAPVNEGGQQQSKDGMWESQFLGERRALVLVSVVLPLASNMLLLPTYHLT